MVYPKSWGPWDLMLERVEANRAKDDKAALGEIERARWRATRPTATGSATNAAWD